MESNDLCKAEGTLHNADLGCLVLAHLCAGCHCCPSIDKHHQGRPVTYFLCRVWASLWLCHVPAAVVLVSLLSSFLEPVEVPGPCTGRKCEACAQKSGRVIVTEDYVSSTACQFICQRTLGILVIHAVTEVFVPQPCVLLDQLRQ